MQLLHWFCITTFLTFDWEITRASSNWNLEWNLDWIGVYYTLTVQFWRLFEITVQITGDYRIFMETTGGCPEISTCEDTFTRPAEVPSGSG